MKEGRKEGTYEGRTNGRKEGRKEGKKDERKDEKKDERKEGTYESDDPLAFCFAARASNVPAAVRTFQYTIFGQQGHASTTQMPVNK
jgi:hypothetical protein